ncbi:hypothetical protein [Pseudomonas fluorescens]|uniref:hypothetical protein n=1 Tax=Pseudomonas fluorescens TaxID=294 RepID=UPI000641DC89|nr:hypothetical protein [Pseudomonas fluorescens]
MNIDWNKAPEGATHKDSGVFGLWYKFDFQRNTAAYWAEHETKWIDSSPATAYNDGSMDCMEVRPPIRASGKEAAEEREDAIATMARIAQDATGMIVNTADFAALYDAGYRKFEIVDGEA